jgi:hypothetical protein
MEAVLGRFGFRQLNAMEFFQKAVHRSVRHGPKGDGVFEEKRRRAVAMVPVVREPGF